MKRSSKTRKLSVNKEEKEEKEEEEGEKEKEKEKEKEREQRKPLERNNHQRGLPPQQRMNIPPPNQK